MDISFLDRSSASGMIYSNRDGSYSDNMNCSWSISSNTNLELIFFRFDTESSYDFVYVYDGGSSSSPLIGQYHGNSLPAAITSSSNQLFVIFTSDGSIVRSGFAASYHGREYHHLRWPWEINANWKKRKLLGVKQIKETIAVSIAHKFRVVSYCSRFDINLNVYHGNGEERSFMHVCLCICIKGHEMWFDVLWRHQLDSMITERIIIAIKQNESKWWNELQ